MRVLVAAALMVACLGALSAASAQMGGGFPMGSPLIGSGPAPATDAQATRDTSKKPAVRKKRQKPRR